MSSGSDGGYGTTSQGQFLSGVPLAALKKAKFLTKVGGFLTMARLVYRNTVYDISKTSQTGAVLYSGGYDGFVFVAPDDRLDFAAIPGMTMGALMDYLYTTTSETRIPAWDDFFEWFHQVSEQITQVLESAHRAFLISPNSERYFQIGIPALGAVSDFPSFADAFRSALSDGVADETGVLPKDVAAEEFQVAEKAFAFGASITTLDEEGNEKELLSLMFLFRE